MLLDQHKQSKWSVTAAKAEDLTWECRTLYRQLGAIVGEIDARCKGRSGVKAQRQREASGELALQITQSIEELRKADHREVAACQERICRMMRQLALFAVVSPPAKRHAHKGATRG